MLVLLAYNSHFGSRLSLLVLQPLQSGSLSVPPPSLLHKLIVRRCLYPCRTAAWSFLQARPYIQLDTSPVASQLKALACPTCISGLAWAAAEA